MLQRGEIDVNVGSQTFRFDRGLATDQSQPLTSTSLGVFFKSGDAYELNTWEMLSIFERDALAAFASIAVFVLGAFALTYVLTEPQMPAYTSFLHAVGLVGSSLILKSYDFVSKMSRGAKLLCLAIGCLSIVMFAYLRAGTYVRTYICY